MKVVSQILDLNYEGVRQKTLTASVTKMNALLGIKEHPSRQTNSETRKTSISHLLYELEITQNDDKQGGIPSRPVSLHAEATLNKFMDFADNAEQKRKEFFEHVEQGKAALITKYGEKKAVPKSEILDLAKKLSPYRCTIWKHQIVVTRTQKTQFEGARPTKDGRWTSTVKSKTIYTMVPLTDSQIEELKRVLTEELPVEGKSSRTSARRFTSDGCVAFWRNPVTGKIVMTEDTSQFS